MNDRFKFRVWDKKNGEYVPKGETGDVRCVLYRDGTLECGVAYDDGYAGGIDWVETGDAVIEQCTGLRDKNGNLIYEGDVLRLAIPYSNTFIVQCVFGMIYSYGVNSPGFELISINGSNASHCFNPEWLEVIGNIHEAESIELSYEEIDFCPIHKDCADLNCSRNTPYRRLIELPVWVANIKWSCKKYKKETENEP